MSLQVYGSSAALEEGGRWTLERCLDLHRAGGSVEDNVDEATRRNIYRKELERSITDGEGGGRGEGEDGEGQLEKVRAVRRAEG